MSLPATAQLLENVAAIAVVTVPGEDTKVPITNNRAGISSARQGSLGTLTTWQLLAERLQNDPQGHVGSTQSLKVHGCTYSAASAREHPGVPCGSSMMVIDMEPLDSQPVVTPKPHHMLYKEYRMQNEVGSGAFGRVCKARRMSDGKEVVIKEIKTSQLSGKLKAATMSEVQLLAKLNHPNIVKFHDCFMDDMYINIVMEFCNAGDMAALVKARQGQLMPEDDVMFLFVQICLALQYTHNAGILHRDLKLNNCMIMNISSNSSSSPTTGSKGLQAATSKPLVKLGDFGVAKATGVEASMANSVVGTPQYLPPEMIHNKPYGRKSDVWALGCVLYELCSLRKAFESDKIPLIYFKIASGSYDPLPSIYSQNMKNLVSKLLSRNPADRPTVLEVLNMPYVLEHRLRYLEWARGMPEAHPEVLLSSLGESWANGGPGGQFTNAKGWRRSSSTSHRQSQSFKVPRSEPSNNMVGQAHGNSAGGHSQSFSVPQIQSQISPLSFSHGLSLIGFTPAAPPATISRAGTALSFACSISHQSSAVSIPGSSVGIQDAVASQGSAALGSTAAARDGISYNSSGIRRGQPAVAAAGAVAVAQGTQVPTAAARTNMGQGAAAAAGTAEPARNSFEQVVQDTAAAVTAAAAAAGTALGHTRSTKVAPADASPAAKVKGSAVAPADSISGNPGTAAVVPLIIARTSSSSTIAADTSNAHGDKFHNKLATAMCKFVSTLKSTQEPHSVPRDTNNDSSSSHHSSGPSTSTGTYAVRGTKSWVSTVTVATIAEAEAVALKDRQFIKQPLKQALSGWSRMPGELCAGLVVGQQQQQQQSRNGFEPFRVAALARKSTTGSAAPGTPTLPNNIPSKHPLVKYTVKAAHKEGLAAGTAAGKPATYIAADAMQQLSAVAKAMSHSSRATSGLLPEYHIELLVDGHTTYSNNEANNRGTDGGASVTSSVTSESTDDLTAAVHAEQLEQLRMWQALKNRMNVYSRFETWNRSATCNSARYEHAVC